MIAFQSLGDLISRPCTGSIVCSSDLSVFGLPSICMDSDGECNPASVGGSSGSNGNPMPIGGSNPGSVGLPGGSAQQGALSNNCSGITELFLGCNKGSGIENPAISYLKFLYYLTCFGLLAAGLTKQYILKKIL